MSSQTVCEVLFRPESDALRFLPEGPYTNPAGGVSWVGIQHGADAVTGSLNLLSESGENTSFDLPGRPGFAFPTTLPGVFVCGVERQLGLFSTEDGSWTVLADGVDAGVENTIINDGLVAGSDLIFGCKDLEFATKKAGLYLYRGATGELIALKNDQLCSNGKALLEYDGSVQLIDIDSPTKTVTMTPIDQAAGTLGESRVIVDVTSEDIFPDGLILTPDSRSVIIAFYDPGDPEFGVARQYGIDSGEVEHVWACPLSPRVTCPQLIQHEGRYRLLLTSAVEGMEPERLQQHTNAGCLFIGDTTFDQIAAQPVFPLGESVSA